LRVCLVVSGLFLAMGGMAEVRAAPAGAKPGSRPGAAPANGKAAGASEIELLRKKMLALFEDGKYAEASPLIQRLIDSDTAVLPKNDAKLAELWKKLGICRAEENDRLGAMEAWYQELCIQTSNFSGDGRVGEPIFRMSRLEILDEEAVVARPLLEKVLARVNAWRANSEESVWVLKLLGQVYGQVGEFDQGIASLNKAIKLHEPSLSSPDEKGRHLVDVTILVLLCDRSDVELRAERKETAEKTLRAALQSFEEYTAGRAEMFMETAEALSRLAALVEAAGQSDEARALRARETGIRHARRPKGQTDTVSQNKPLRDAVTRHVQDLYQKDGAKTKGIGKADERPRSKVIAERDGAALQAQIALIPEILNVQMKGGKEAKLKLAAKLERLSREEGDKYLQYAVPAMRGGWHMHADELIAIYTGAGNAEAAARVLLRTKGIVADSLADDRRVIAGDQRQLQEAAAAVRESEQQLGKAVLERDFRGSPANAEEKALRGKLKTRQIQLQEILAGLGPRTRTDIDPAAVQAALAPDEALVEYTSVARLENSAKSGGKVEYLALVFTPGAPVRWVPLGSMEKIDDNIELCQKCARAQGGDAATLCRALQELHRTVWAPVAQMLDPKVRRVVISPHADLNFLSWATLLEGDHFAAEKFLFRYVQSGRDLLRPAAAHGKDAVIFADPVFAPKGLEKAGPVEVTRRDKAARGSLTTLLAMHFPRLASSAAEAGRVMDILREKKWSAESMVREDATEARFRGLGSPAILHVATHGYTLSTRSLVGDMQTGMIMNFMPEQASFFDPASRRNGLIVSGIEGTFAEWRKKNVPPLETDGLVTCEDVAGLNLDKTWLVTLAACDSGTGENDQFEINGLRRAFTIAGARNIVNALWPVNDDASAELLARFYARALELDDPARALAEVQRDALVKIQKEKDLLSSFVLAGAWVTYTQGSSLP
jgi:CHAT domain-containing protein